ncbi:hypothetical protein JW926_05720 [Candidatus Sumerlaeota bacterium]|nr:hypothetical protein [Candidatus Sumerlaeota bacterium]
MLERLNSLEEKLDSVLHRLISLKKERDEREEENRSLKSQIDKMAKDKKSVPAAGDHAKAPGKETREWAEQMRKSDEENKALKKKIAFLEKELENKTALEEETMGKLRDILKRIDALEAEIGELENEQINPDNN